MIELSKRQRYLSLIALMTVTQKVCLKKGNSIRTTFTPRVNSFCLFAYIFKQLLLKIDLCIFLPNKCILRCSIRAIHEKYVTLRYQMNL